jgi:hypothetical protein
MPRLTLMGSYIVMYMGHMGLYSNTNSSML